MSSSTWRRARWMLCLLALLGTAAAAQPPSEGPDAAAAAQPDATPTLDERRAQAAADLAVAKADLEAASTVEGGPPAHLRTQVDLLERLQLVLSQQANAVTRRAELVKTETELTAQVEALRLTGAGQTLSFLDLETLRNELAAQEQRRERVDSGVKAAQDAVEQAKRVFDDKERARRQAREAADTNAGGTAAELGVRLKLARLESRLAAEQVALREAELRNEQLNDSIFDLRVSLLDERIRRAETQMRFTGADLSQVIFDLDAIDRDLQDRLELAQRNQEYLESQLFDARRRLDAATEPGPALQAEADYRRMARQFGLDQIATLGRLRQMVADLKIAWNRRFDVLNARAQRQEIDDWLDEVRQTLTELDVAARFLRTDLADAQSELVALQIRLDGAPPEASRWVASMKPLQEAFVALNQETLAIVERSQRVNTRLADELARTAGSFSVTERIARVWDSVVAVWRYPFTTVDDREITVGKVIIGLFIIVLGLMISRLLSTWLGKRLLRRLGMPEGAAAAIQALAFYLFIGLFVLLALRVVNVPLTAFTILGGALAIGVGFGSQTIIRNFFSGLILLAERPIRVGDLIEVGDLYGTVESVGARSTRVRTGDNVEIVVPNAMFLEQQVVNWTLSETRVRVHVTVGVIYGSPTRDVTKLLIKSAQEHGRVLKSPAPFVLFTDFGDNALIFEVHFWIQMRSMMDRRVIESDIRYRIDALFHEAKLVIAFPQRDVHLDSARPIDVNIIARPDAEATTRVAADSADGSAQEKR